MCSNPELGSDPLIVSYKPVCVSNDPVFVRYDRDGDGVLDVDELALMQVAKAKTASDERMMDTNHDGG